MSDEVRKYLLDIQEAILSINVHLGEKKVLDEYLKNKTIRRAVEREMEIIGEAMSKILKMEPNIKIKYTRQIIDLRNKVIHAYDNVDDTIIWKIFIKDLPELKTEISHLLNY